MSAPERPKSDNHALLIGLVHGALLRCESTELGDLRVEAVILDETDYSDTIRLYRRSGTYLVRVTPEEP